jgi:RNA-directed DNA polymerase
MLTALETGVKGGCWFALMDKVFAERNLGAAAAQVIANKGASGVDHGTIIAGRTPTLPSRDCLVW